MESLTEKIIDDISTQGYAVVDDLFSAEIIAGILKELQQLMSEGKFNTAGLAQGVRGDLIHWVDRVESGKATSQYFEFIQQLQQELNRYCYLGLSTAQIHYAHYPKGTYYKRHLDHNPEQDKRKVSVLLYLNEDWSIEDGGELILFLKNEEGVEVYKSIRPLAGRFLCFMSDAIEHEVLPSQRDRYSLSGWLLGN